MNNAAPTLDYPYEAHPKAGTTQEIAPGVRWLTMPMGGSLTHINLYLLEDNDGWYVVDTGLGNEETTDLWHEIFAKELGGKPVKGVICTHMHPDHIGCAAMIVDHFRVPLHMTRAEYYQARSFSGGGSAHHSSWQGRDFYLRAGMPGDYLDRLQAAWESRSAAGEAFTMPTMPMGYNRLEDGDVLTIGDNDWQIVVGSGHSPEHACLLSQRLGIMLSGDQILPIITSNVSVHTTEPEANPLLEWMDSLDMLLDRIPPNTLVLPAHNLPFRRVRTRLRELIEHHEDRMLAIEESCSESPKTAKELLPVLFKRELDARQMMMALGEGIAHVHLLIHRDRIARDESRDGAYRFTSIDPSLARRKRTDHDAPDDGPMMV